MKKSAMCILCCIALLTLFPAVSRAERVTEYQFKEITVRVPDRYMTLIRTGALLDEGAAGDAAFDLTLEAYSDDSTYYLDAIDLDDGSEIIVRVVPIEQGVDFAIFNDMDEDLLKSALEQYSAGSGIDMESARVLRHPQITFAVYEGKVANAERNETIAYFTMAAIDGRFYGIYVSAIGDQTLTDQVRQDLSQIVETLTIEGYPDIDAPKPVAAHSAFTNLEGLPFGLTMDEVEREEGRMGNNGDPFVQDALTLSLTGNASCKTLLSYEGISCLLNDQSRKSYLFDQNDLYYAIYYEFRIDNYLNIDGPDDIDNYAPAYQAVEEYLVGLLGDAQYAHASGTKCEVDGYGMQSAQRIMDGGLDDEMLYGYSEWLIDDPLGTIKVEHIMWFSGYIYMHNLTFQLIPD